MSKATSNHLQEPGKTAAATNTVSRPGWLEIVVGLEFKHGTASLTGLSVVLSLVSVLGLKDLSPTRPGLYLPELLSDSKWFLDELRRAGATISEDSNSTLQIQGGGSND